MPTPEIETFTLGPFATNCYVVSMPVTPGTAGTQKDCWIIDASFGPAVMIDHIRSKGLNPKALILTHAHADHIAGVEEVRAAFPSIKVLLHAAEREFLANPVLNLSAGFPPYITCRPADQLLEGGETLMLAGTPWRVLHTPGHSPGGITLVHDDSHTALVGDTLFHDSIGRFDFPTSNQSDLVKSIQQSLYKLPAETKVFPGHGPTTTIAREMKHNQFVRA